MKKTCVIILLLIGVVMAFSEEKYRELTSEEKYVIEQKGTEKPFTGEYYDFYNEGIYRCKRCGNILFRSGDKFHSGCGWPSFDDAVPGAVKQQLDVDGMRTEIICNYCGAHLGHVFLGEGFTDKNTRYCVNSLSLSFEAAVHKNKQAIFAGGCFWGMQYHFDNVNGVVSTIVGYAGGKVKDPAYKEVSSGKTGHAEAIKVIYNPDKVSYEELARLFFEIHDPTQLNRQGPDIGTQYRSVIFYSDEEQKKIAEKLIGILKERGYEVVTEVQPATEFYPAEDYHQDYYEKTGKQPYCHIRVKRFEEK